MIFTVCLAGLQSIYSLCIVKCLHDLKVMCLLMARRLCINENEEKANLIFFFLTLQEIKGTAHTPVMPCIAKKSDYLYRKYFLLFF